MRQEEEFDEKYWNKKLLEDKKKERLIVLCGNDQPGKEVQWEELQAISKFLQN